MTYSVRKRWTSVSCVFALLVVLFSFMTTAFAAGTVTATDLYRAATWEDEDPSGEVDLPEWDVFVDAAEAEASDVNQFGPDQYARYVTAVNVYNTFGNKATYDKAVEKLRGYSITYDYDADSLKPANETTKGQQDLARAEDSFNSSMGAQVAENTISGIFDTQNFNPSAGAAAGFLDTFYMIVNTIFFVVSNVVIWWFLAQTSFDMLYILCEPLRPIIGPASANNGGGFGTSQNANGGFFGYVNKAFSLLHLCSSDVAAACGEGGGGMGMGQNASGSNPWMNYMKRRAIVVICVGVYLVLVSSGWWPRIIAWVAGIVTRLLGTIVN